MAHRLKLILGLKSWLQSTPLSTWWLLLGVIGVLLFTRLWKLTSIPAALTHDEMIYVVNAKAVALTGSDITGTWKPWSFQPVRAAFAELPVTLMTPSFWFIDNPIFAAKAFHVLLGMLFPFVLGWLVYTLLKQKQLAWITIIIASVNPWLWQISRMAFDPFLGVFFYCLAAVLLLQSKPIFKLSAFVALVLGFFSYQGLKLILVPWTMLWLGYDLYCNRVSIQNLVKKRTPSRLIQQFWPSLLVMILSILLFGWYVLVSLPQQSASIRVKKLIFTDTEYLEEMVNTQRRLSLDSAVLPLVSNKASVIAEFVFSRYTQLLGPEMLFLHGEASFSPWSVWSHGFFYLFDGALVLFGLAILWRSSAWKVQSLVLLLAFAMAPMPALVNTENNWFMFKAGLLYMLLIIPIAVALWDVSKQPQKWIFGLVSVCYLISVVMFGYHYFWRYPVYAPDGQFFAERVIASYLHRLPDGQKAVVYTQEPEYLFNSYIFYNSLITTEMLRDFQKLPTGTYSTGQVTFTKDCFDPGKLDPNVLHIAEVNAPRCNQNENTKLSEQEQKRLQAVFQKQSEESLSISAILDSRELYRVYQDKVCEDSEMKPFISIHSSRLFAVESLNNEDFCQHWIADLRSIRLP
jgi:hypothetical protein